MQPHEIITLYATKPIEYAVAILYLLLFVGFWRFVNGEEPVSLAPVKAVTGRVADFFRLSDRVFFHPGHGWARPEGGGLMTVGLDDFAQQLVGPIAGLALPKVGAALRAGSPAWSIEADSKSVDMLAPVTGTVVAVNEALRITPGLVNDDPYGGGWLAKVRVPHPSRALPALMWGREARAWMDRVSLDLTAAFTPELGRVSQDGGVPIHGFAHGINQEHWDDVARQFLLS